MAQAIAAAPGEADVLAQYAAFEKLAGHLSTMATLAEVRHTIDTRDAFYEAERQFFDENSPRLADKQLEVYKAVLASPHRAAVAEKLGSLALEKMELAVKSQTPEVLELMAQENALTSAYQKLYASAQIPFQGQTLTVAQLAKYKTNADRAVRKAAYEAEGAWFDAHSEEFDSLYDQLVKNRTAQAQAMGYENFVPLGAIRMNRLGYTRKDMAAYRAQVKRDVVPVVAKLKQLQYARTGISQPKFYDDVFCFKEGNPAPHGTPEEILAAGREMYHALSPETAEFIDEMFDGGLFDVLSKEGKAPGGYCTYLADYKAPFIFSNFNGTSDDVDVLTHEAGHAFAAWVAARKDLPMILEEPGMESCEIHSMSMEFLTAEHHEKFFGTDTPRYELAHAEDAMYFLPYGTMVDEFQHIMYAEPDLTPGERNAVWAKLESEYRPWLDFAGLPFYGRGAGWQRQLHIYEVPFYYIDYCLAQTVALQFFTAFLHDKKDAWRRYLALVGEAGGKTYPGLVAAAGLDSPFAPGTLAKLGKEVGAWIAAQDAALNAANQAYGNASIQCSLDFGRPLATYKYVSCYFGGNGHRGTDYAAPGGTEIYAVSGGVVTAAAYHWSWGYYVQVYHGKDDNGNTYSTLYAHMNSAPVVSVGQPVEKGKVLGYVGSTGNSTGNHLHLEMKVNNVLVNVMNYLS